MIMKVKSVLKVLYSSAGFAWVKCQVGATWSRINIC